MAPRRYHLSGFRTSGTHGDGAGLVSRETPHAAPFDVRRCTYARCAPELNEKGLLRFLSSSRGRPTNTRDRVSPRTSSYFRVPAGFRPGEERAPAYFSEVEVVARREKIRATRSGAKPDDSW